ncbi:MAG: metal-dependent hydrolase [Nanoarchaeota archaeon]
MRKRNHISWTFAISLWIYYFIFDYNLKITLILSIITAWISFLPDIDITIVNYIKKFERFTLYLSWPITVLAKVFFRHRKITHTLYLPALFFIVAEIITVPDVPLTIALRIFYLAITLHIIEDMFTVQGIDFLYPLPPHLKLGNFTTKSYITMLFLDLVAYTFAILFFFWNKITL